MYLHQNIIKMIKNNDNNTVSTIIIINNKIIIIDLLYSNMVSLN